MVKKEKRVEFCKKPALCIDPHCLEQKVSSRVPRVNNRSEREAAGAEPRAWEPPQPPTPIFLNPHHYLFVAFDVMSVFCLRLELFEDGIRPIQPNPGSVLLAMM